jgi:hypothetical protein
VNLKRESERVHQASCIVQGRPLRYVLPTAYCLLRSPILSALRRPSTGPGGRSAILAGVQGPRRRCHGPQLAVRC